MGLENVCRLCRLTTSQPNELSSLFENDLDEKLRLCCSIDVEFNENLPSKVCPICKISIEHLAHFRKRCEDTNSYFNEYLQKKKMLKKQETSVLAISTPKITSRIGSPRVSRPVQQESSPKVLKSIPLPFKENQNTENNRFTVRQYSRKQKATPMRQHKITLFQSESPVKIKEEPRSVAESLVDDWNDDNSSHKSSDESPDRHADDWEEAPRDETQLKIKAEPFDESFEAAESPRKRIIGEEVFEENRCNLVAVFNAGKNQSKWPQNASDNNIIAKIPPKIRFHCTECSTGFYDELFLLSHACGNLRYACYICKKIFLNEYALVKHMNEHQNKSERSFKNDQEAFREETDENVYSTGKFIRMESTHKRQKTMYFTDN
ncbi:uncharacterized protein LOC134837605 [Culicoides brevitarsis]|uniref:uncharacterized protein LOC134837605 n=1 Tax=Culicoides brevitarsis TaxID=469753 RepID=UPI00307C80E6